MFEALDQRIVPAVFTVAAGDVSDIGNATTDVGGLVWAIDQANATGGTNTIGLAAGATYDFTQADNYWYGPNALPAISSSIVVQGNGATLERDSSLGQTTSDAFRFFYVSGGLSGLSAGNLTLDDVTLENGLAKGGDSNLGGGGLGAGGAIFNQGNLTLDGVTLSDNSAIGGSSGVTTAGNGGGGMGQDAPASGDGGGFGGVFPGAAGGAGGSGGPSGGAGGGGGFSTNGGDALASAANDPFSPTYGGVFGGAGGSGDNIFDSVSGTDGGGGGGNMVSADPGADGGAFGLGGFNAPVGTDDVPGSGGGGGGIGGGGGAGVAGGGGGFGGGGGGGDYVFGPNPSLGEQIDVAYGGASAGGFGAGNGSTYENVNGVETSVAGTGGDGAGGAIFSMFGTVTLQNTTMTGNTALGGNSPAAQSSRGDTNDLSDAATTSTAGGGYGGGIFNLDDTTYVYNSSIDASNVAVGGTAPNSNPGGSDGGAIYNFGWGVGLPGDSLDTNVYLDSSSNVAGGIANIGSEAEVYPAVDPPVITLPGATFLQSPVYAGGPPVAAGALEVIGTPGQANTFSVVFTDSTDFTVTLNGQSQSFTTAQVLRINYTGNANSGGQDTTTINDPYGTGIDSFGPAGVGCQLNTNGPLGLASDVYIGISQSLTNYVYGGFNANFSSTLGTDDPGFQGTTTDNQYVGSPGANSTKNGTLTGQFTPAASNGATSSPESYADYAIGFEIVNPPTADSNTTVTNTTTTTTYNAPVITLPGATLTELSNVEPGIATMGELNVVGTPGEANTFSVVFTDATDFTVTVDGQSQSFTTAQVLRINYTGTAASGGQDTTTITDLYGQGMTSFEPAGVFCQLNTNGELASDMMIDIGQSETNYVYGGASATFSSTDDLNFGPVTTQGTTTENQCVATSDETYLTGRFTPAATGNTFTLTQPYADYAIGFASVTPPTADSNTSVHGNATNSTLTSALPGASLTAGIGGTCILNIVATDTQANTFSVDFTDPLDFTVMLNGQSESFTGLQVSAVDYTGTAAVGGQDTTSVSGVSVVHFSANFAPGSVQVSGSTYTPTVNINESLTNYVYVNGALPGGAWGTAQLFTTANPDSNTPGTSSGNMFVGTPGYSYMTGQFTPTVSGGTSPGAEAYANFAVGFASAYGYASSSADQASIYSGSTATVAMTPGYSYLSNTAGSSTNSSFADGFGNTYAYADGGDSAFLYDAATVAGSTSPASASGVSFVNNPAYSYMSGAFMPGGLSEFFNETEGFAAIYAEAEGSGDIAYLQATGSSGTPELAFANGAAGIKDSSGEAVAVGFQLAFATGTSTPGTSSSSTSSASGTNIPAATSPPSSGSGTIVVAGNQANAPMVTPDGSEVAYSNGPALDASGFGNVNVDDDDDSMAATDFVFNQLGNWTG